MQQQQQQQQQAPSSVPKPASSLIDPVGGASSSSNSSKPAATTSPDVSAGADVHFISQLKVGSRVAARFRASDPTLSRSLCPNWYEGRVVELKEDGTFRIHYDDGDKEDGVLPRFMRPPKNG